MLNPDAPSDPTSVKNAVSNFDSELAELYGDLLASEVLILQEGFSRARLHG